MAETTEPMTAEQLVEHLDELVDRDPLALYEQALALVTRAERAENALAEARAALERTRDPKLIRLAISDPGAFVKRERFNDGDYETVPAWGARAVLRAFDGEETDL